MGWGEPYSGGGYRGRYRDADGAKQYVLDPDGQPFRRKSDAKEAADEEERKAQRRAAVPKAKHSAKITFREWREIVSEKRLVTVASDTLYAEKYPLRNYVAPRWDTVPLNQIKREDVQAWIDDDLKPGRKNSYVLRIYAAFSVFVNKAVDRGVLEASPLAGLELPSARKKRGQKVHITDAQEALLCKHLPVEYQRLLKFQRRTGLRPGEVCALHASMVDDESGWVHVKHTYVSRKGVLRSYPKDEEDRDTPLLDEAHELTNAALAGRELTGGCGVEHADERRVCRSVIVFLGPRGRPIKPFSYAAALARACVKAKIETLSPYAGRRAFATLCAEAGVDAFTIAAWMGHSDIKETDGYVQRTQAKRDQFESAMAIRAGRAQLRVVGQKKERGADAGAEVPGTALGDVGSAGR